MAREQILIGCRLPNGLTITLGKEKATILGLRDSKIIGSDHMTTPVDAELWAGWKKVYSDYQPLKTGAIFEARSSAEAKDKAKELKGDKTGLEPMSQDAAGVKKEDGK